MRVMSITARGNAGVEHRLYFEDLHVGQRFRSGTHRMEAERIIAFGREFDPQPQHVDPVAARATLFGELVASGWHTAAITMRLAHDCFIGRLAGAMGGGVEELAWVRPVRAGDALSVEVEILSLRPSRSRPQLGVIGIRMTTFAGADTPVQRMSSTILVRRREAADPA